VAESQVSATLIKLRY